ncbi:MAG: 23S rRNA (adenine(2503)-C(2))-methyltransferase [Elusimicrobia bacterium RIFCSPLOWO2_01_FULL_60_11]|nr:MAG: 23S rRNA (adenine(2503)-C(2))-methyltransferase [Elusimicrobia bacterium RIFCSPLOWO2_01_FULL_60_11]
MTHLLDFSPEEVGKKFGGEAYRTDQVLDWVFTKRVRAFGDMTSLPQGLRAALPKSFALRTTTVARSDISGQDSTAKFTLETGDKKHFACVLLPEGRYQSLCISSQVGCAWACAFCASGLVPLERNLTSGEILDQVFWAEESSGKKIRNVLFMGMGEPLANPEGTAGAIRWLLSPKGFGLSPSRVILSTTGLAPQILKISKERFGISLALSLHAPDDVLRKRIMPKSAMFPIQDILTACKAYVQENDAEFTVEYILLKDVNDSPGHARALAKLVRGARFPYLPKINLIPQNPVPGISLTGSTPERSQAFFNLLKAQRFTVHTRKPKGQDLGAACGQLQ